jgi:hypothetical protein
MIEMEGTPCCLAPSGLGDIRNCSSRASPFAEWCQTFGLKMLCGEFNEVLFSLAQACQDHPERSVVVSLAFI